MSDFSDAQDRRLVQLACMYEHRRSKISWVQIARKMKGQSTTKLANRLKTLQNRHGKQVLHFPAWYFVKSQSKTKRSSIKSNAQAVVADKLDQTVNEDSCDLLTRFNMLLDEQAAV